MYEYNKKTVSEGNSGIEETIPYWEAVGSLRYLAVGTHPDIAFAVSEVSWVLDKPTKADWEKVKCILQVLKRSISDGHHEPDGTSAWCTDYIQWCWWHRYLQIVCITASEVVCQYMGGPISWLTQRQKSVALSTTEAEFMAASEAAKQIIWLTRLLSEITSLVAVHMLKTDNMSAVKLVKNPTFH